VQEAKNVEKQTISFSEEMLTNVGEKAKNEVNESLGKVSDNIEQVQIKKMKNLESWLLTSVTKKCVEIT